MGSWHIVKTNYKKNKISSLSILLIILLTSLLLVTGVTILDQVQTTYDSKSEELNSVHGSIWINENEYQDSIMTMLQEDPLVASAELEEAVYLFGAKIEYGAELDASLLFMNWEQERELSRPRVIEEDTTIPEEKRIYLPYYASLIGYSVGDEFQMAYKQMQYSYTVAGFFESIEYTMANGAATRFYLGEKAFLNLAEAIGVYQYIGFRCENASDTTVVKERIMQDSDIKFTVIGRGNIVVDSAGIKEPIMTPIGTLATILVGTAFIIVVVAILFIRFRILNSIDSNMLTFGTLQALGYTNKQIIRSFIIEYGIMGIVGVTLGGIASILSLSQVQVLVVSMCGITFRFRLNLIIVGSIILLFTILIVVSSWLSCRKIKGLTPIIALRGGVSTHSFRKDRFALSKGAGSPVIRIGMKNVFQNPKSYFMILLITTAISFVLLFCASLYQVFVVDNSTLMKITGYETADMGIMPTAQTDVTSLAKEIEALKEVRKTSMYDEISFYIDKSLILGFCSDDFSKLETVPMNEGSYPALENEIVISSLLAEKYGKEIGDGIKIKDQGMEREYLITGFFSTINNGGLGAILTETGYRRLMPSYQRTGLNVYFNEGYDYAAVQKVISEKFGVVGAESVNMSEAQQRAEEKISRYLENYDVDSVDYAVYQDGKILFSGSSLDSAIVQFTDLKERISGQIGIFRTSVSTLVQFIYLVAAGIVFLIISLTVKNMLKKNVTQLGIQKAMGFETKQLMLQYTISFLPALLIGALCGLLLGVVGINPVFSSLLAGVGAGNIQIQLPVMMFILISIGVIFGCLAIVLAVTYRIRKISVYSLMSE